MPECRIALCSAWACTHFSVTFISILVFSGFPPPLLLITDKTACGKFLSLLSRNGDHSNLLDAYGNWHGICCCHNCQFWLDKNVQFSDPAQLFSSLGIFLSCMILQLLVTVSSWVTSSQIRKAAADQVYLVLLQNGSLVAEDKMERALDILAETCWEGAVEEAKLARSQLYEIAGLEADSTLKTSRTNVSKSSAKKVITDENASYSSLVDSTGF